MPEVDKILVVHDVHLTDADPVFSQWLDEFRNNIISASNRLPGINKNILLSRELPGTSDQDPRIPVDDFNYFLIVVHEDINRTKSLKAQFDDILNYLKDYHSSVAQKKVILILLDAFTVDHEILNVNLRKIINFYSHKGSRLLSQSKYLEPQDREYWMKILQIINFASFKLEPRPRSETANKSPTVVYAGLSTPDLEGKRDLLISDLIKRGITVLPELIDPPIKNIDEITLTELLEYSELSLQFIGGAYGHTDRETKKSLVEKEYDTITNFLEREPSPGISPARAHKRIIWMPSNLDLSDTQQEKFINRIKSQISYLKGDTELISGSFEQLKELVLNSLSARIKHRIKSGTEDNFLYIIHEKSNYPDAAEMASRLKAFPLEVVLSHDLDAQKKYIRAHLDTLIQCDAVFIYYDLDNVLWFESIVKDILKTEKINRSAPFKLKAVIADDRLLPKLPKYEGFRYMNREEVSDLDSFYTQLMKMIG
jgi:hypothetical protein